MCVLLQQLPPLLLLLQSPCRRAPLLLCRSRAPHQQPSLLPQ